MVAAFLQAEVASPRWGPWLKDKLAHHGLTLSMVTQPDLADAAQNERRSSLLARRRGWRTDRFLFVGFPWDLCWQVVEIDADDIPNLRYANTPEWAGLSRGTLLPSVGAKRIGAGDPTIAAEAHVDAITAIATRIRNGESLPPAIAMGTPSGTLIVFVEGHARITAHLLADVPNPFRLIYGCAPLPRLRSWLFFPPDAS